MYAAVHRAAVDAISEKSGAVPALLMQANRMTPHTGAMYVPMVSDARGEP